MSEKNKKESTMFEYWSVYKFIMMRNSVRYIKEIVSREEELKKIISLDTGYSNYPKKEEES